MTISGHIGDTFDSKDTLIMLVVYLTIESVDSLRGLDGPDHFKTVSISFRKRALYKTKYFKGKIYGVFLI